MNWIDWTCIALYIIILAAISLHQTRKIRGQNDVFLAGRSMRSWPIAISMYMAVFSTNTFLGVTGWLNRPGGSVWIGLQTIGIIMAVPFVVLLFPSLFYRLRITTAYEYLEKRFNWSVRTLATLFFAGSRVMWMGTMLYSSSLVICNMLGWHSTAGQVGALVLMAGVGALIAFTGGMHAVIWTDVVQFFIFFFSVALMIGLGVSYAGGWGQVIQLGSDEGKFAPPPVFDLTGDLSLLGGLLLGFVGMLSSSGADQMVLQTYLTAKSEREAKKALWRNALFLKPLSLVYPLLGLVMFAHFYNDQAARALIRIPDDALPVYVMNVLPVGVRGLMIVAILAAVLDSLASGMASLSAAIQVDYLQRWSKRTLTPGESVRMARGLVLASAALVVGGGLWIRKLGETNNIIEILNIVMYPFTGVLLGIFLLGIGTRRATGAGALAGGIAGFVMTIAVPISRLLLGEGGLGRDMLPVELEAGLRSLGNISNFYFGALGALGTVAVGYAASLLDAPPPESRWRGLTRRDLPDEKEKRPEFTHSGAPLPG